MATHQPRARASCTPRSCPNPKGAERAVAARADELELVVSASETHNQKNVKPLGRRLVGRRARRRRARRTAAGIEVEAIVSTAFGCPYEGDVAPERVAQVAGHLSTPAPIVSRSATRPAWRRPRRVDDLLDALDRAGDRAPTGVGLHFHNTRGTALANVVAALERGVTRFDASIGGLGGCPYAPGASGNAVTEDLVHMLPTWTSRPASISTRSLECARLAQDSSAASCRARCCTRARAPGATPNDSMTGRPTTTSRASTPNARCQGNLAKEGEKLARQHKLFVRDRLHAPARRGLIRRGRLARQRARRRPAGRRRRHRRRPHRRAPGLRDGERLDRQGRIMGRAHGREDRAAHRTRAAARAARRVPRRLRRRAHHRPGRAVPGPARRRPHLRQPSAAVRQGPPGVLPVRAVGRGRRVHSGVLRRRLHGRGQRLDVPRFAAHGRSRDRREDRPRRDGRRPDARNGQRLRRQPVRRRRRGDRGGAPIPLVPADELARGQPPGQDALGPSASAPPIRATCAARRAPRLRHAQGDRRARR